MKETKKVFSRAVLARMLSRRGKQKIVFTNGCFDLLHVGHVRLFKKARSLGDKLVVAVNSDDSVRRLKGSARPLVSEKERAELLASLNCVDYVIVFDEDTPLESILALKPDVLIKGADYGLSEIVGNEIVKKVVRFPIVKGVSTTNLIKKVLKAYGDKV